MPNFKILAAICICAVVAITLVFVLITHARPIATVNAISVNLHTTPDASASSRMRTMRNGKWQEVTLPNGTRVRIVQQLENGWDKIAVEAMGDTGQPPTSELTGFVNGKLLTLVTDKPATTNSQPSSTTSASADSTRQPGTDWLDRVSIAVQNLVKGFGDYQKNKGNTAKADTELSLAVTARWVIRGGAFGLQFKSYVVNFTNTGDTPIKITRIVINKRVGVEWCDVNENWVLQNYGDSEEYQFGVGQYGGSLIRVDYETNVGWYSNPFDPS